MKILIVLVLAVWTFSVPLHNLEAQETNSGRTLPKEVKAAIQRLHQARLQDIPELLHNRNGLGADKNFDPVPKSIQPPEVDLQHLSKQSPPNPLEQMLKKQNRSMTQSAQAYRIDTVIQRGVSDTTSSIFTYYPNGVLSFGSSTIFPYRLTHTYDASGREVTTINQNWVNGQWTNSNGDSVTYNAHGNVLTQVYNPWLTAPGQAFSYSTYDYTYDTHGNPIVESSNEYLSGSLASAWTDILTYDANNNLLGYLITNLDYSFGQPDSTIFRGTYIYDAHGNQLINGGMEVKAGQIVYQDSTIDTYNANDQVLTDSFVEWDYGQLTKSLMSSYAYDANGNLNSVSTVGLQNSLWIPANGSVTEIVAGHRENFSGYNIIFKYELAGITGVSPDKIGTPNQFSLLQNYPIPFIPSTSISFTLLSKSFVTLKVFDLVGREVATIMRQEKTAATYHVAFDASKLPSSVYFYKLTAGEFTQVKKMLLIT